MTIPDPREMPTLDVETAGQFLGLGRSAAYAAAREWLRTDGSSGMPAIRVGHRLRVPTASLWRLLGLEQGVSADA